MTKRNTYTLFMGSARGNKDSYVLEIKKLAKYFVEHDIDVVYGGGKVGLMGVLADEIIDQQGEITGVMPGDLIDKELGHDKITKLEIVPNMHERKETMARLGNAFVALPGGSGTLEEIFEAWTWQQLGFHSKPIAFYNVEGFWDELLGFFKKIVSEGFMKQPYYDSLIIADTPEDLVKKVNAWVAPAPKWEKK